MTSLTFSVFPKLTTLWTECFFNALTAHSVSSIIGDCSGGYLSLIERESQSVYPYINIDHGQKLDTFVKKICHSDYVIICDDDVFWLNDAPLIYAINALAKNPNLAVVSLMPRRSKVSGHLSPAIDWLMGSYCLVIKRSTWHKEGLSFSIKPFPDTERSGWYYDTSDFAHQELINRGYEVLLAPSELQENLITFEGISSWLLKIQKHKGRIYNHIKDVLIRQEKAYRAILVAEGLSQILVNKNYCCGATIVNKRYLNIAKSICLDQIPEPTRLLIENQTEWSINLINRKLANKIDNE